MREGMRADQELLKEELLPKLETNQEKMEARIYANNEKLEVLRGSFVSRKDIHQARPEDIQEEIINNQDGRPSGKDGSLYEYLTRRDDGLPRNDGGLSRKFEGQLREDEGRPGRNAGSGANQSGRCECHGIGGRPRKVGGRSRASGSP
jgi:hypothetical protein